MTKPFAKPESRFTLLHNSIFDVIMRNCSNSEWKVLCAILRKTRGYQKDTDRLSYSQILEMTGIGSNTTIKKAIDGLEEKGMVIVCRGDAENANEFTLNENYAIDQGGITESVEGGITESVEGGITESVDTKESLKESLKKKDTGEDFWLPERLQGKPIPAKTEPPHSAEEAKERIRNAISAFAAEQAEGETGLDVAHYPEEVQEIISSFAKYFQIAIPQKGSRLKGKWIKDARELNRAISVLPMSVDQNVYWIYKRWKDLDRAFDVYDMGSLIKFAYKEVAKFDNEAQTTSVEYGGGFNFIPD